MRERERQRETEEIIMALSTTVERMNDRKKELICMLNHQEREKREECL